MSGDLPHQTGIELHSNVNLCPVFLFEGLFTAYLAFREDIRWILEALIFLGKNGQHMPLCAKMISSWISKVLGFARTHMSQGTVQGAVVSVTLVVDVSLVSILQVDHWANFSMAARHLF